MAQFLPLPLLLMMALSRAACGADSATLGVGPELVAETFTERLNTMKIRIRAGDKVLMATLIDSETTRDFVSLLPLTLMIHDLSGREKSGDLPRPISEGGKRTRTYEVGDMIYWSPSPHLAIYYRHDGQSIPSPGIIVLGKTDSDANALNLPGSVKLTIELDK